MGHSVSVTSPCVSVYQTRRSRYNFLIYGKYLFDHILFWTYGTSDGAEGRDYCGRTVRPLALKGLIFSTNNFIELINGHQYMQYKREGKKSTIKIFWTRKKEERGSDGRG